MAVLGLAGGGVIASVYLNRTGPGRKPGALLPAAYALGWFVVGTLPAS